MTDDLTDVLTDDELRRLIMEVITQACARHFPPSQRRYVVTFVKKLMTRRDLSPDEHAELLLFVCDVLALEVKHQTALLALEVKRQRALLGQREGER
jgi:hypothetical protein